LLNAVCGIRGIRDSDLRPSRDFGNRLCGLASLFLLFLNLTGPFLGLCLPAFNVLLAGSFCSAFFSVYPLSLGLCGQGSPRDFFAFLLFGT
jgi:hypothetical protein